MEQKEGGKRLLFREERGKWEVSLSIKNCLGGGRKGGGKVAAREVVKWHNKAKALPDKTEQGGAHGVQVAGYSTQHKREARVHPPEIKKKKR